MPQQLHFRFLPRISIFILFIFYLAGVCPETGFAQGKKTNASLDSTKITEVINIVSLANIGTETENTLVKIREIRDNIQPSNLELEIDTLIPKKLKTVEPLKKELDLEEIGKLNLRQSENMKNDISQMRFQLDDWRSILMKKTEKVNAMKVELSKHKSEWDLTMNLEREEKLPKKVTERIQTNLKEISALNKELTIHYNALLTRQDELTGALIFLDEVLNAITKTEQLYRTQIHTLDSPPIWQAFSVERDTLIFEQKFDEITTRHNNEFRNFTENYRANMFYHILFFVVLLLIFFYIKKDVSKWSDEKKDETIRSSLHIISKPFSASLLIALSVTTMFYSEAPPNVLIYFHTLLVLPILTIVPGLISGINRKYFYYVGGVFLLSEFANYFSDLVILERSIILFLDVVTIVMLYALLRSKEEIKEKSPGVKWGFAFFLMRLCIFLLGLSALANSVGNTVLSKIVSNGSHAMIYGGAIIYAGAILLRGLFALIMQLNTVSKLNMIQNYSDKVKERIFQVIRWAAVIYWLYLTFSGYLILEPIYNWFEGLITKEWTENSNITIGSFLAFFITLWISLLISRFIRFILQDEILTHFDLPRGVPGAISLLVKLVLITTGFILAFGAAGIDMSKITIIFGALGVGIGFGLQNIFNNLISGLILAFERPIQTGDIIQIASLNLMGEVKEIGIRASTVRTFDGAEVIVPNGNLISNEMINWTLSDRRKRQEIIVGVEYGTDTNKVLEILNNVVPKQENVLKNPGPLIIFVGFGESSLNFRVLFWTHFDNGLGTKSAVGTAIDDVFKKEGIKIPFPQRDLHLRSISDEVEFSYTNAESPTYADKKTVEGNKSESTKKSNQ